MTTLFLVDTYSAQGNDTLPLFYASRVAAELAGLDELARVADLDDSERAQEDWADGYSVRAVPWADDAPMPRCHNPQADI